MAGHHRKKNQNEAETKRRTNPNELLLKHIFQALHVGSREETEEAEIIVVDEADVVLQ